MNEQTERSGETILQAVEAVEREAAGGAEALRMAVMLAPSPLPYDFALSVEGTPHNPSLINPAAAFFAATATMEPLIGHDLIKVDAGAQIFQPREDVRNTLRGAMTPVEQLEWAGRAIYGLNLVLPDAEPHHWPTVEWLMPHVLACRDLVLDLGVTTAAANRVLHQAGFSLYHQQQFDRAAEFLRIALDVDRRLKGEQHPDICADLEGLGTVLWAGDDLPGAEAAFAECLAVQQTIFTEDNPVTAPILNSLAVVRQAMGRFEAARATFEECRRILILAHGEAHPSVASCLGNQALLLEAMGHPDQALPLAEQALAINVAALGEQHPDVAGDLNTVGLLKEALGDSDGAETAFRAGLETRRAVFGDTHPETAQAQCNLALLLDRQGRTDEAASLYEQGLTAYEASLGPGHPLMEDALDKYLVLLETTGRRPQDDRLRQLTRDHLETIVKRRQ